MAEAVELDRQQQYMMHCINWVEIAGGYQATVMNIDLDQGAVQVFGKDNKLYRKKLKDMMRRYE